MIAADVAALCALSLQLGIAIGALLALPTLRRVMRELDDVRRERDDARTDAWQWRKLARGRMRGPRAREGGDHSA